MQDLGQAEWGNIWSVILGGVIFNASNILLSASTSIAGLSVAFPLGVGLSLVLGVIINYIGEPKGDPVILFIGVALIVVAKTMDLNDFCASCGRNVDTLQCNIHLQYRCSPQ